MILDARDLLDFFDRRAAGHWSALGRVETLATVEELTVSPFVIGELEAMVRERYGPEGWLAVLDELAGGAWTIAPVAPGHLAAVRERVAAGEALAGASVAVLAEQSAS